MPITLCKNPWPVYRLSIIFSASGFPVIIKFQPATCNPQPAKDTCQWIIEWGIIYVTIFCNEVSIRWNEVTWNKMTRYHMYNLSSIRMQCNFIHDIYLRQSGLTYTDHGPSRHSPCYAYRKLSLGLLYSEKMNKRSRYKLIKSYISFWLHLLYERWFRQKAEIKQHSQTHSSDLTKCSSGWQFGTSSCND